MGFERFARHFNLRLLRLVSRRRPDLLYIAGIRRSFEIHQKVNIGHALFAYSFE